MADTQTNVTLEIARIIEARNSIRTTLNGWGIEELTATIDECAETLAGVVNQGAVNATVKEGDSYTIPAGYHSGAGVVRGIAGGGNYTLQTKTFTPTKTQTAITADSGYYGLSSVTVAAIPAAYQDVTSVTASAADVLATKVFVASDGTVTTGTMTNRGAVTQTLNTSTTSYTIPKGYHSGTGTVSISTETKTATPSTSEQTISPSNGKVLSSVTVKAVDVSLPAASSMLSTATATVTSGDTTLGTVTGTIASKTAATYYPSTTAQEIAAGKYLSGKQTIAAVLLTGLTAGNIKHGAVVKVGDSADDDRITSVTGSFYNDGTTYTLSSVGTSIDMGASSSHRYITTSGLQVIPTATYTASGAVTNADITGYGKLTIGSGGITENAGSVSTGTTPVFTQGTVSASAGWITAGTKVSGATFANTATASVTYKDISGTAQAPILKSGDYLYINKGYTDNVKISLSKLTPDGAVLPTAGTAFMLSGYSAYDNAGSLITGTIESLGATTHEAGTTAKTIAAGKYLSGTQTIAAISQTNLSAGNIKKGTTITIKSGNTTLWSIAGTYSQPGTGKTGAAAGQILSGYTAFVNGSEVTGTMTNNGAISKTFDPLTQTSVSIPSGYTTGGSVTLTDDLETLLASI